MVAVVLFAGVIPAGCWRKTAPPVSSGTSKLKVLPVEMTVKQRTTTSVPGSGGAVQLTADDITRGQVMVSVSGKDGGVLLGQTSLERGKAAVFKVDGESYTLTLKTLSNAIIGEDFATFTVSQEAAPLAENARIERLLAHISSMEGATFIRNGGEHTPADAASHLRTKWKAADDDGTMTAAAFVAEIATKSSMSDEPYRIRLKDGPEVAAGDYLRAQLNAQK